MKTEISKSYPWGFFLTEQELRRIFQTCHEHAEKAAGQSAFITTVHVTLKNGAIVETAGIDDVLSLENGGARAIQKIKVRLAAAGPSPAWLIGVYFEIPTIARGVNSVGYHVTGESRDWAFVASADLEDRLKKIKLLPWTRFVHSPAALQMAVPLGMLIALLTTAGRGPDVEIYAALQAQYSAGLLKDPVQAMIALEKIKSERSILRMVLPMFGSMAAVIFIVFAAQFYFYRFGSLYTFYWADQQPVYDRRRQVRRVMWTVVILGLIVSIAANFFSKQLGI